MYKKVAILLIMCLTLAGCSSKKVDNTTLDNSINNGSISNQIENNQYTKPNIEYAHDNMGNQDIGQYDSGIYSGDVKLSESYDYSGKTFSGESTNQIEDSEQSDYENTNVPVVINDATTYDATNALIAPNIKYLIILTKVDVPLLSLSFAIIHLYYVYSRLYIMII